MPVRTVTRCPTCDKVASQLIHQKPEGGREAYVDPKGRMFYRCLDHGAFTVPANGQPDLPRHLTRAAEAKARVAKGLVDDWLNEPGREGLLVAAERSASEFVAEARKVITRKES